MALERGQFAELHRQADPLAQPLARAIVRAVGRYRSGISSAEARAMAADPNLAPNLPDNLGDEMAGDLRPVIQEAFARGQQVAAKETGVLGTYVAKQLSADERRELGLPPTDPANPTVLLDFAGDNVLAVEYAEREAARLVTAINSSNREAIRALVADAIRFGGHPRDIAPLIEEFAGMTPRQVRAARRLQERLGERGLPPSSITRQVESYTRRAVRSRALTIARTEVLNAANAGLQAGWEGMTSAGLLDPARSYREWIITFDEKTCPICAPLDGQRRPMGVPFETSEGAKMRPPAHPNCRCTMGISSLPPGVSAGEEALDLLLPL